MSKTNQHVRDRSRGEQNQSSVEQGTTNVVLLFSLAQETTDSDILDKVRHWKQPPNEASSWSELKHKLTDLFMSAE